MGNKGVAAAFLIGLLYVAALFLLVRPQSQGPTLVENTSNGLTDLIKSATGGGTW
jgi:hypothetical protein